MYALPTSSEHAPDSKRSPAGSPSRASVSSCDNQESPQKGKHTALVALSGPSEQQRSGYLDCKCFARCSDSSEDTDLFKRRAGRQEYLTRPQSCETWLAKATAYRSSCIIDAALRPADSGRHRLLFLCPSSPTCPLERSRGNQTQVQAINDDIANKRLIVYMIRFGFFCLFMCGMYVSLHHRG